jgi:hypothetical protein
MRAKENAVASPSTVRFNLQVDLDQEQIPVLTGLVAGDQNDTQKLVTLVSSLLKDTWGGGLMLSPEEMARITEATGLDPESGEDLIPLLSEAAGRSEGKLSFRVSVDPVYEEYYREPAEMQGRTVQELIQEIVDTVMDGDPLQYNVGSLAGYPEVIRMTQNDKAALEKLLGAKFQTGTDLAKLIQESLGGGLFEEIAESNVGQEK